MSLRQWTGEHAVLSERHTDKLISAVLTSRPAAPVPYPPSHLVCRSLLSTHPHICKRARRSRLNSHLSRPASRSRPLEPTLTLETS
ncbi:unnamed protein product [Protopolystoma xenopodis]|uniref:Uncharacterized protein n=1 Tax=Protopolystoma xenopodis TaxID=117903 RepID=A0A3S5CVU4_9PLAT|nr:unnamed protein product [Protopolystoma xenopodis]